MATLQNIRNRSGLLLAVIGIAMLAFIMGDLFSSWNSGGPSTIYVGEVLGEDILVQDFQQQVDEGIENWKIQNPQGVLNQITIAQIRDQIWNQYIRDLVMENEFQELGIDVSDDEFFELLQGVNVHPEISKVPTFQDPKSGKFDRTRVLGYLKQIDQDETGEARNRWVAFQKYLIGLIKSSKYNSLVGKSMYTTNEEARIEYSSSNSTASFNYVAIPYTSVDDLDVQPTDDEIEDYYRNHDFEYQQEASKDVDFVVYTAVASEEDEAKTKFEITQLITDFENYDDYNLIVRRNSDNTNSVFNYIKEDELQDPNWKDLFNAKKGTVLGPYQASSGVYRIAKLVEIERRPDSVEARHILIKPTQTMSLDSVNIKINALKLAIESGADFSLLAKKNSEDQQSAVKGGDLGWFTEGQMVDEFNEVCFTSKRGDLSIVTTQFGVHLIEVTKYSKLVKKVKIAYIDRNVEPSTETFNLYYSKAASFAGKILNEGIPFDTLIANDNLVKRSDQKVTSNKQNISGLANSREMVRWMHTSGANSVSEVFQFDNSYVVAYITKEYLQGVSELDDVKEKIKSILIKQKKALKISESVLASDLSSIAEANSTTVINNKKAVFSNLSIEGIGYEPELVGAIFSNESGLISAPIIGKNAVYIVEITNVDKRQSDDNLSVQKSSLQKQAISYANNVSYNALKDAANIKDNRVDFY